MELVVGAVVSCWSFALAAVVGAVSCWRVAREVARVWPVASFAVASIAADAETVVVEQVLGVEFAVVAAAGFVEHCNALGFVLELGAVADRTVVVVRVPGLDSFVGG